MLCKSVEVIPHVWERASRKRLERVGPFKKVKCKLFGWTFGLSHLKWAHQIFREPVGNSTRLLVGARGNTWCASPACGELQRDVLQSGEEKKSSFYEDIKCSSDKVSHIAASMLWLLLATIVPVPKKPWPTQPNYYRPVALMPVIIKCLEKLLLNPLVPDVTVQLVHLPFAYVAMRAIEDVMACVLHLLLQHLDSLHHFVRILFVDFSSAFPEASDDPEATPCQHHLLSVPLLIIDNYF